MKHMLIVTAGLAVATLSAAAFQDAPAAQFEWLTDLDAARSIAAKENKPLLAVFR